MDGRSAKGAATRSHLLAVASTLFAAEGYDAVSIEAVLKVSGISRGALYHHFNSKDALFTAVLEAVEQRIVEAILERAGSAANPLDALRAGCQAWLNLVASDEAVRRIAVIDASTVLGWQAWREMEGRYALGMLRGVLAAAAEAGCFAPARSDIYASMLLAVVNEMAMVVARAQDRPQASAGARDAIELLVSRLIGVAPRARWQSRTPAA